MNKAADSTTKSPREPNNTMFAGTIATDMLDTAWRIAVPVILCAVGGLILDKKIGTAPWFTLLGTIIGFVFAGLLVKKQIDAINRREAQQ